jgi:hypothetical protein
MSDEINIALDEGYWDALRRRGVSLPPVHLDFGRIPWKEILHPRGRGGRFRDKPDVPKPQVARLVNPVGKRDRGTWAPGMTLSDSFRRMGTKIPERVLPKIDYKGIEPKLAKKIKTAETVEGLALAMGEHYPHTDFDFDGLDVETMRELMAQYSRLSKDFPEVNEAIVYVGAGQNPENTAHSETWLGEDSTWAYAGKSPMGSTLMLHPYFFGAEYADLQASLDENVRSGWHPEGADTPSSILTHEFGHHVDWWIEKAAAAWGGKKPPPYLPDSPAMMGWDGSTPVLYDPAASGRVDLLREEFRRALHQNLQVGGISDYAKTNPFEAFAETFATMYHGSGDALPTQQLASFLALVGSDSKKWDFTKREAESLTAEGIAKIEARRASLGMPPYGRYHLQTEPKVEVAEKQRIVTGDLRSKLDHGDVEAAAKVFGEFLDNWPILNEPGLGLAEVMSGMSSEDSRSPGTAFTGPNPRVRLHHDPLLGEIAKAQGFDALPQVVPEEEMDAVVGVPMTVRLGAYTISTPDLWRGVSDQEGMDFSEQFRSGDYYPGKGTYGNGIYATEEPNEASGYGTSVSHLTFTPDARVADYYVISKLMKAPEILAAIDRVEERLHDAHTNKHTMSTDEYMGKSEAAEVLSRDWGRFAAALGYDAMKVSGASVHEEAYYVILNRGAVIVSDKTWSQSEIFDYVEGMEA